LADRDARRAAARRSHDDSEKERENVYGKPVDDAGSEKDIGEAPILDKSDTGRK